MNHVRSKPLQRRGPLAVRLVRATLLARVAAFSGTTSWRRPDVLATLARPAMLATLGLVLSVLAWLAGAAGPAAAYEPTFPINREPRWQPAMPSRHFPPCPGPRWLIDRMISSAGGWRRWRSIRTISQVSRVQLFDTYGHGRPERQWDERYFFATVRGCPHLVDMFERDGHQITFGTNGREYWALVDDRPRCDAELLHEATKRLREIWFWLRFPFSLRELGLTAEVGGMTCIEGGRRAVWLLDVLPAKTGDGWPLDRLRLLVNQSNHRLEGVVYPKLGAELTNFRARTTNHCTIGGITLPHRRDVENEEGVIARETTLERLYDVPLSESIFHMPVFDHY